MQLHTEMIRRLFPDARVVAAEIAWRAGRAELTNYDVNVFWNALRKYTTADVFRDPNSPNKECQCECTPLMYTIDLSTKPVTATLFTSVDRVPYLVLAGLRQQFDDSRKYCVFLVPSDPPKLLEPDSKIFFRETDIDSVRMWQEIVPVDVPYIDNSVLPQETLYRRGHEYLWADEVAQGINENDLDEDNRRAHRMTRIAAIASGVALNVALHLGDDKE